MMFLITASAFVVTLLAYAIAIKIFPVIGLLDFPGRYQLTRAKIPYPTGIIAASVFLAYFMSQSTGSLKEWGLVIGIVILALTCFMDDRKPLPSLLRLTVHLGVVFIIFASGSRIYTITNPLEGFISLDTYILHVPLFGSLPILSGIFTVAWLLLTINAMNWFDGISGQVGIVSAIGFLMLGFLAEYRNDQPEIAQLAYTLFGIAAAGAFFDFPPAKMLLGDSGSMFFGLMLGVLGVYQGGKVATAFLALGIPLLDATFVIIRRIAHGKSPMQGGHDHLHHRLRALGFSERTVVILTASVGTIFGVTALFLSSTGKGIAVLTLVMLMLLLQIIIGRYERQR